MGLKQAIKNLDAFPRAEEHLLQKTQSGAVVSIVGLVIIASLFLHELRYYITTYTVHQMAVDLKRGETLPIHINMTFPSLPCDVLSVDAIDMSGKHEVDLDTNIWKDLNAPPQRYDKDGDKDNHEDSDQKNHLHGFDQDAETMIKKVKQALGNREGCRVYGVLDVQRVAGNFHISVHGLNIFVAQMIVPTEYRYLSKEVLPTNQFSVTEYYSPMKEYDRTWPAVYFLYDLSPITVTIREERRSFLHFITRLCAVLGGTFALTGMLDRWMCRILDAVMKPNARSLPRSSKGERELGQAKMNHNQQSSDGRHDEDTVLSDFLASLMDYTPTIPDQLVEHYLAKSGFQCPDVRLIRLVAVATQKFIAEVATDALQQCKARQAAVVKDKRDKQQKDKRLILTMEDLSKALRESICNWHIVLVLSDGLQNSLIRFRLQPFYADFRFLVVIEQYGVNVKHQEYFADSPTTGLDPASRVE
ncbi:hypothetical protein TEA_011393 [Camellia sinensis var. sinensis]|uniref:Transcription initiation factor TFIID subunit 10 n=1 Tax=Camellia sinensis var. sinensis TaxID=542762 RepID=A0A4V3WPJ7_CAMSN|nr:hypothetical protein TEA_011393 [Camellia sinensis var. sinensis]